MSIDSVVDFGAFDAINALDGFLETSLTSKSSLTGLAYGTFSHEHTSRQREAFLYVLYDIHCTFSLTGSCTGVCCLISGRHNDAWRFSYQAFRGYVVHIIKLSCLP
jgi:hypothetical protein